MYYRQKLFSVLFVVATWYMLLARMPGVATLWESLTTGLANVGGSLAATFLPESIVAAAGGTASSIFTSHHT